MNVGLNDATFGLNEKVDALGLKLKDLGCSGGGCSARSSHESIFASGS